MSCKVGIVGAGVMGRKHLSKFLSNRLCEVIGFYDSNLEKSKVVQTEFNVTPYSSIEVLLLDTDAVVLSTPTETHYALARRALESGNHVLVEKPLASTPQEAESLIAIAEREKKIIQVGHLERFRFLALRKHFSMDSLCFFQSMRLTHQLPRERGIDVITDLMVHDLDLLLSLLPSDPISIQAQAFRVASSTIDIADAWLEFSGGVSAHLKVSRVERQILRKLRLCADETVASFDFLANEVDIQGRVNHLVPSQAIDALELQCDHFLTTILEGTAPLVTASDALRSLKLCEAIRESARTLPSQYVPTRAAELETGLLLT